MNKKTILYLKITTIITTLILIQIACSVSSNATIQPTQTLTSPTEIKITPSQEIKIIKTKDIKYGIVSSCEFLNLRKSANENSQIIITIPVDSKIIILSNENENWYEVIYKDTYLGYVNKKYITKNP